MQRNVDKKELINKLPAGQFGLSAGITVLVAGSASMFGLPLAVVAIPAGLTLFTGYAYLQDRFSRTNLDNFFTNTPLRNSNGLYPVVKKTVENEYTKTYFVKMPDGLCTSDFENFQEEIEQFLNRRVSIDFSGGLLKITSYRPLKSFYKFETVPCDNPLEICPAYGVYGTYRLDIEEAIHILLAGATGAGKSVALRCIICALILTKSPRNVILNLVDFQRVELGIFKKCRMVENYCTSSEQFGELLDKLKAESDRRIGLFENDGVVNIQSYNKRHPKNKLPYIVTIVDEFASLSDGSNKDVLKALNIRMAQDRKCGQHFIVCTQRPTVDIINGSTKANMPCRIALKASSQKDSESILDIKGAEKLKMGGNALVKMAGMDEIQFMYLSETDAYELVKSTFVEKKPNKPIKQLPGVIGNANQKGQNIIKLC